MNQIQKDQQNKIIKKSKIQSIHVKEFIILQKVRNSFVNNFELKMEMINQLCVIMEVYG